MLGESLHILTWKKRTGLQQKWANLRIISLIDLMLLLVFVWATVKNAKGVKFLVSGLSWDASRFLDGDVT